MSRGASGRHPGPRAPVVVGRRPALEAVRAGAALEVLVARTARPTPGLRRLLAEAEGAGVPVRRVDPHVVEEAALGTAHQGVVVRTRPPATLGERDLDAGPWPPDAVVVVLDGVTDPGNVGAVARSAEAAGASALVVRRRRGGATSGAAVKASAGALLHLPVVWVANIPRAIGRLKDAGFWAVGLDGGAVATIWDQRRPSGRLALVLGSEGGGLSRLAREACDELVAIPLRGRVESLNVAAAAAVALFGYAVRPTVAGEPSRPERPKSRTDRS